MIHRFIVTGCLAVTCLFQASPALSDTLNPSPYCPTSITDTDGDGWGWENGRSCRVISSSRDIEVCPVTGDDTDPDDDGWGWHPDIGSCLVDNTSIDQSYTIINNTGTDITHTDSPVINSYVKAFGTFSFSQLIAADGTLYQYRIPDGALAAIDGTGNTLWLQKTHSYIELMALSEDDNTIYATVFDNDHYLGAYDSDNGQLLQKIVNLDGIGKVHFGEDAVIAVERVEEHGSITGVKSVNYDGTIRWHFLSDNSLNAVSLGKDGKVYIKYQSGQYGNEATLVLTQ